MSPETATLLAAVVAAVAAIVAAVLSALSARASRKESERAARASERADGREQWWTRFSWAMEKAMSSDAKEVAVGLKAVDELLTAEWATPDDLKLAAALGSTIETVARGGADE